MVSCQVFKWSHLGLPHMPPKRKAESSLDDSESSQLSGPPLGGPEKEDTGKFRVTTLLVTLSPKDDVTDKTITEFGNYCLKKCRYWFIVEENGANGKRHLHAAICMKEPIQKRYVRDYWASKMTSEYPGSIGKYACVVTVMYNHDWYNEYLRKGGTVILDQYDPIEVGKCFPTQDQQAALIEARGVPEARMHLVDEICEEWKASSDVFDYERAVAYLKWRMHVLKKQPYFLDPRKLQQFAWFMYEHVNQIVTVHADEKNYANRMTGMTI